MIRFFATILLVLFTALSFSTSPRSASAATVLKVATSAPDNTPLVNALRAASEEIAQRTGNSVQLTVFHSGVMGSDETIIKKLRTGQIQGAAVAAGGVFTVSDFSILTLPFLFRDAAHADRVMAEMEPELMALLRNAGYVPFGILDIGFVYVFSQAPVRSPEDLPPLRIWAPEGNEIARTAFEVAGVTPVPLPVSDVLTALQTNLLDSFIATPLASVALQWFVKAGYMTDLPLLYSYGTLIFADAAWRRIAEKDRLVVEDVLSKILTRINTENRKADAETVTVLQEQGIRIVVPDPQNEARFRELGDRTIERLGDLGIYDKALLQRMLNLSRETAR